MMQPRAFLKFIVAAIKKPLLIFVLFYAIYYALLFAAAQFPATIHFSDKNIYLLRIGEVLVYFWIILNLLELSKARLLSWLLMHHHNTIYLVVTAVATSVQAAIFLFSLNLLIPQLSSSGIPLDVLDKTSKVVLIGLIGFIVIKIIDVVGKIIEQQYVINNGESLDSRKINTQLVIIKRLLISICIILTIALIFRVFDTFKNVGTGLLTTAGLLSAIGAFASQQSLGRIFAGLHIAFTQPIRIGDTVIIENEFGQVEEITLSYIVIKLWDLRRLILPTDYFTSKGLQNLTRTSSDLLGTVFLYTDYTLPVMEVRTKFFEFLNNSSLWDKKVGTFQVTDIKESSMEIRALVSAENSNTLWNLRCEIREKLIEYIVKFHPASLSKARTIKAS